MGGHEMSSESPNSNTATASVIDCLDHIGDGDRTAAVALALDLAGDDKRTIRFLGVRLLYLLRLYEEALQSLREHLVENRDDAYATRLHFSMLKRLRFEQEAETALGDLLQVADDVAIREAAVLHYRGTGRPDLAIQHSQHVIRVKSEHAGSFRMHLALAAEAHDLDGARQAATRALQLEPQRWLEVIGTLLEIGLYDSTEREARKRLDSTEARAVLGEIALYRGDLKAATEHAAAALEAASDCERAVTVLVGAAVLAGDLERADRELANWPHDRGPTLKTWHAELLLRRGELEAAQDLLTKVQNDVPNYLAAKLIGVLVKDQRDGEEWATSSAFDGLLEGQIQALGVELTIADDRVDAEQLRTATTQALQRLSGNRTPFPSIVDGGELRRVLIPASPRHRAREAQHRAPWLGLGATIEHTGAELARIGSHPIGECYAAELDLWSGDYVTAENKFQEILRRVQRTVWAWIGLGASQILLGRPDEGLESIDQGVRTVGFKGATVAIYRGEALYRLGRHEEAEAELAEACRTQPGRMSAWVLRVLVSEALGLADERDKAFGHLDTHASALLSDTARDCGVEGWWPGRATPATQLRIAEHSLELMRGNRSSSCSFWFAPGEETVRSVIYRRPVTSPGWETSEIDNLRRFASGKPPTRARR